MAAASWWSPSSQLTCSACRSTSLRTTPPNEVVGVTCVGTSAAGGFCRGLSAVPGCAVDPLVVRPSRRQAARAALQAGLLRPALPQNSGHANRPGQACPRTPGGPPAATRLVPGHAHVGTHRGGRQSFPRLTGRSYDRTRSASTPRSTKYRLAKCEGHFITRNTSEASAALCASLCPSRSTPGLAHLPGLRIPVPWSHRPSCRPTSATISRRLKGFWMYAAAPAATGPGVTSSPTSPVIRTTGGGAARA